MAAGQGHEEECQTETGSDLENTLRNVTVVGFLIFKNGWKNWMETAEICKKY